MQDVIGKGAFITGGASGIGLGMARAFARAGMKVVIADIRADHLEQAREDLAADGFEQSVLALKLDVTDRNAYDAAVIEAEQFCGRLHVLCNNAGIGIASRLGEAGYADWDWAVDVNLNAVFNGIKAVLPRIRAHGEGGHVVNTASMAGLLNYSSAGVYVATKFAVVGLSEALRAELAPHGIGVSAFCPGGVRSNIRDYEATRPARYAREEGRAESPFPRRSFSEEDQERLSALTANADDTGEQVLQGIRDNALYIFTAPEFRPGITDRFDAIFRALGHDQEREKTALDLIPDLVGSPIYRDAP